MLREAKNVHLAQTRALLVRRYTVFVGKKQLNVRFKPAAIEAMQAAQQHDPVPFIRYDGRQYWWFADAFWSEDEGLHAEDVRALVLERLRRKNRRLENARLSLSIETAERTGLARVPMSWVRRPRGPEAMVPGDVYELRSLAEPDSVALIVVDETQFLELERCGASDPTLICSEPTVWYYRGEFFTSTSPVQARDVALFASQRTPEATRRPAISEAVQRAVYERDGGACVKCGSRLICSTTTSFPSRAGELLPSRTSSSCVPRAIARRARASVRQRTVEGLPGCASRGMKLLLEGARVIRSPT